MFPFCIVIAAVSTGQLFYSGCGKYSCERNFLAKIPLNSIDKASGK